MTIPKKFKRKHKAKNKWEHWEEPKPTKKQAKEFNESLDQKRNWQQNPKY